MGHPNAAAIAPQLAAAETFPPRNSLISHDRRPLSAPRPPPISSPNGAPVAQAAPRPIAVIASRMRPERRRIASAATTRRALGVAPSCPRPEWSQPFSDPLLQYARRRRFGESVRDIGSWPNMRPARLDDPGCAPQGDPLS
jgi:hypothetical protein